MSLPADHSLAVRKAVVTRLLASAGVVSIVAGRFYGQRVPDRPVWPFGRYGAPDVRPFEATGLGGSEIEITLHAYARGADEAPCSALAAAIVEALSSDDLVLEAGIGLVSLDWLGTQILKDGDALAESGDFHAIIRFQAVTAG